MESQPLDHQGSPGNLDDNLEIVLYEGGMGWECFLKQSLWFILIFLFHI